MITLQSQRTLPLRVKALHIWQSWRVVGDQCAGNSFDWSFGFDTVFDLIVGDFHLSDFGRQAINEASLVVKLFLCDDQLVGVARVVLTIDRLG